MKFNLKEALEILESTPSVLEKLLGNLNQNWLSKNEGKNSWTPAQIICHLIHCEDDDWITRLDIILKNEDKTFKPFDRTFGFEKAESESINTLLNEFKRKRNDSLQYLKSLNLNEDALDKRGIHPEFGEVTLRQLLATWAVHDLSHTSQITRVMSYQYKEETGPWKQYLPILNSKKI